MLKQLQELALQQKFAKLKRIIIEESGEEYQSSLQLIKGLIQSPNEDRVKNLYNHFLKWDKRL